MTTFEKHYIGKGTQVEDLDIVKVVIPAEMLENAIFESKKDGKFYLSFEVAKLKEADKYGRTHTCYYQTKKTTESSEDKEPAKTEKADKKNSKKKQQETR